MQNRLLDDLAVFVGEWRVARQTLPQLVQKIHRLQRAVEALQRSGGDVQPIQKLMQQVGPLLQQGQVDKAEKLVVEALKLADEKPEHGEAKTPRD